MIDILQSHNENIDKKNMRDTTPHMLFFLLLTMTTDASPESEDAEIVQWCLHNKKIWQEKLYKKYAPKLLGVAMRYCKDRDEAEDVLQESMVKIFGNMHQLREVERPYPRMKKILINTALLSLKKEKKNQTESLSGKKHTNIPAKDTNNAEAEEALLAMQTLPNRQRLIFNLYAIEWYTHKEIAELLWISESGSKTQYMIARKKMNEIMKNEKI